MFRQVKEAIKAFFYFSNAQANGLCFIVVLIFLLMIAPKVYQLYYKFKPLDHSADAILLEQNLRLLQANAIKKPIDINRATVQQLETIEGITPKLALTIIGYRDKLGGFVSLNQYKEIYGLAHFLQVRLRRQTRIGAKYDPKQLSLNHATFKELVAHPYISFAMAKAIITYRKRQGSFSTLAAIQMLPGYHSDWAKKIMPYLSLT